MQIWILLLAVTLATSPSTTEKTGNVALILESVVGIYCRIADDINDARRGIDFWLYTRQHREGVKLHEETLEVAPWAAGPLKVLVHGYTDNKDKAVNKVMRPALLEHDDYNVIAADWSALAKEGCYVQSVKNIPLVGKVVGEFFNAVTKAHRFGSVHLLGHSLGAHVAAMASEGITNLTRLTKFDPAGPFISNSISRKGRAHLVDVYHSNAGREGQKMRSGDVDVYFNQGTYMPGCACDMQCSHLRCVEYFAESLRRNMKAFACDGWDSFAAGKCPMPSHLDLVTVGAHIQAREGVFLAFTNIHSPYNIEDKEYMDPDNFRRFKSEYGRVCKITDLRSIIGI